MQIGVRFIRWGLGLLVFGIFIGFGIIGHYIRGAQYSTGHEFLHNVGLWPGSTWSFDLELVGLFPSI